MLAALCVGSCRGHDPGEQLGVMDSRDYGLPTYEGRGDKSGHANRDERLARDCVTSFPIFEKGSLISTAENSMGVRVRWEVPGTLESVAEGIVLAYRDEGSYELLYGDYLDLFGLFWGCLVTADEGWSELVFVDGRAQIDALGDGREEQQCLVTVVRLGEGDV